MKLNKMITGHGKKAAVYALKGDEIELVNPHLSEHRLNKPDEVIIVRKKNGKGTPFSCFAEDIDL